MKRVIDYVWRQLASVAYEELWSIELQNSLGVQYNMEAVFEGFKKILVDVKGELECAQSADDMYSIEDKYVAVIKEYFNEVNENEKYKI